MSLHSTLTSKGQTTIPLAVRDALGLKAGDRIEFSLEGGKAVLWRHPGAASLAGALRSERGRGMSFSQVRAAAASARTGARR